MTPDDVVQSVQSIVCDLSEGLTPFDMGPFDREQMISLAGYYLSLIDHRAFLDDIEKMFTRGENPNPFIINYIGLVFLTGVSAATKQRNEHL